MVIRRVLSLGAILAGGVLFATSWASLEADPKRLAAALPRMGEFFGRMLPPDMSVAGTILTSTLETVQIAFVGTVLAVVASIPLGLLGADNLTPGWVHRPIKTGLAVVRAVPLILLALFFVSTVGLGPLPGVLAIAIHSVGMLAKFYSEASENAGRGALEALDSAGASWSQKVRFAVWPQVSPDLVRDTLFRFELNVRESLILGLVGAGGIGFYIHTYVRSFQYGKVATLTVVVLILVVLIEQASAAVRKLLR